MPHQTPSVPQALTGDVKGSRVMLKAVSTQSNGNVAAHSGCLSSTGGGGED